MARRRRRTRSPLPWLVIAGLLLAAWWFLRSPERPATASLPSTTQATAGNRQVPLELPPPISGRTVAASETGAPLPAFLPDEARQTIALIRRGGPYPHRQDGGIFGNREGHLPEKPRGWYREYTVETPGLGHRGARRIVTGGHPPREWYYTADHYESFRRFDVPGSVP